MNTVSSKTNPLAYLKAIVGLIGAVGSALLAVYGPDTEVGQILNVVVVIATAVAIYLTPNAPVVPNPPES